MLLGTGKAKTQNVENSGNQVVKDDCKNRVEILKSGDAFDEELIDVAVDLIELKAINRMLVASCWDALQLRGIWTALNDPLALDMEKRKLRERFKQIELGIRVSIEKADSTNK